MATPWKINMEYNSEGLEDDFPDFNWVFCRFHVNFEDWHTWRIITWPVFKGTRPVPRPIHSIHFPGCTLQPKQGAPIKGACPEGNSSDSVSVASC